MAFNPGITWSLVMQHSRFPPSGMTRLMHCAGSLRMIELYGGDQEPTPESIEGTLAAEVAAHIALRIDFNHPDITDEMIEFADKWVEIIKPFRSGCFIESRVVGSAIHPDCFGTPDFYRIDRDNLVVEVMDYKYGHKPTDAYWQLITYAICIKTWLKLDNEWTFKLGVYQPRARHRYGTYRSEVCTSSFLNDKLLEIRKQIELALSDEAKCTPSKEGCYKCPAAHRCDAYNEVSTYMADWFSSDTTPFDLTPAEESAELDRLNIAIEIIKNRAKAIENSIIGGIKHGKVGYSYVLESTPGREVWKDEELVEILADLYNLPLMKKKPVTPKQALRLKLPKNVVDAYSTITMGSEKLVPFKSSFKQVGN